MAIIITTGIITGVIVWYNYDSIKEIGFLARRGLNSVRGCSRFKE